MKEGKYEKNAEKPQRITPVIAALLLIAISVAAAIVTYSLIMIKTQGKTAPSSNCSLSAGRDFS